MNQSLLKNRNWVPARSRAIKQTDDRQLPTTGVQFLNLESILRLKMVYVYFPVSGYCFKND